MTATFTDSFEDLSRTGASGAVALRRSFPRIVTRPDVRINPTDPTYYRYAGGKRGYKGRVCGYGWFPYVLKLASGDLLCFYTESSAHVYCPGGRAVSSRSRDGGRTWDSPQVLYYKKDWISHIGYGVLQDATGRIWVGIRSQLYDDRKGVANDPRAWKYQNSILASDDDGQTWTRLRATAADRQLPRPVIEMSSGHILWTARAVDDRGDEIRATCLHSEKDGVLSFHTRPHPELGPTSDEWYVVETRTPGRLVCMMRQQQHSQYFATATSFDYGATWTPWRESDVFMGPFPTRPMLRRMNDGTLLFTYGQRWIGRTFAVASHDEGETWDNPHRQTILHSPGDYHKTWDSHYTDIASAEGSRWLAVDYIASPRKEEQKGIYGTFIDGRHFREVHQGVTLASVGRAVGPDTVGHWSFDELEGDFARDPVAANFGEIDKAERVPGKIGPALAFDGRKSHVTIYDDATLRLPKYFALEVWIRAADPKRDQTILSKAPRYTFCLRGGKLALRIGDAEMVAEGARVPANRWVHVAVTFGMRRMYSRATFYLNGAEDSWVQPAYATTAARPETFAQVAAQMDTPVVGGPQYQEYGHKNQSTDNLVIGMDNNLRTGAFEGVIDEVAIHREDVGPERIAQSARRHYFPTGEVTSLPLARPAGASWWAFRAETTAPAGTKLTFCAENQTRMKGMEYRTLGKTGLEVSRLVLGAAQHGDVGRRDEDIERSLHHALDSGINFIDTASLYNRSEERIGRLLASRRDEFYLATKCGSVRAGGQADGEIAEDYTRNGILRSVEESRRQLRMDVVDLVQFHGLPPGDLLDEAFETLLGLKEKGWARFVGVSADGPAAAAFAGKPTGELDAAELARRWPVDTWQFTYNFLSQEAAAELMPILREQGVGTIVKRPISNVVWAMDEEPENDFYRKPWQRARRLPLRELAGELSVVEFALRFALSHADVDVALTGTTNPRHLEANVAAAEAGSLPEEVLRRARRAFREIVGQEA